MSKVSFPTDAEKLALALEVVVEQRVKIGLMRTIIDTAGDLNRGREEEIRLLKSMLLERTKQVRLLKSLDRERVKRIRALQGRLKVREE